jgi:hypothetical protein
MLTQVDRAVWFVRAFGGVEIQSLAKTRPQATAIYLYTTLRWASMSSPFSPL